MAKQGRNTVAAADPNAVAGTSATGTGSDASKAPRKATNPDETIYWNKDRDLALINLIRQSPGQLTTKRIAESLAQHPSFAGDAHLLATESTPEKIRQRVKKLSKAAEKRGYAALELQRRNNTGYDYTETLDEVFGTAGVQSPQTPAGASSQPVPGPLAGGLIPVPTAGQ